MLDSNILLSPQIHLLLIPYSITTLNLSVERITDFESTIQVFIYGIEDISAVYLQAKSHIKLEKDLYSCLCQGLVHTNTNFRKKKSSLMNVAARYVL